MFESSSTNSDLKFWGNAHSVADQDSARKGSIDKSATNEVFGARPKKIFVMGCGRSGTWLSLQQFGYYQHVQVVQEEMSIANFCALPVSSGALVAKRDYQSHLFIEQLPPDVQVVWVVRHPFDVLTSVHKGKDANRYHVSPGRLLHEMLAVEYLLRVHRPNTTVFRYEDLCRAPEVFRAALAKRLNLSLRREQPALTATDVAAKAMHGVRPPDQKSVGRWSSDPVAVQHLRQVEPRVAPILPWLSKTFGYTFELPVARH